MSAPLPPEEGLPLVLTRDHWDTPPKTAALNETLYSAPGVVVIVWVIESYPCSAPSIQ